MARRLSFDGYDGGKPVAIPDVPAPVRGGGRAHSLARVLEIALEKAGLRLGYDAIMGLCGLAFRTPPWPKKPTPTLADETAALNALSRALGDCLTVLDGGEALGDDELIETVAEAVAAGNPCIALGWGSDKDHWSIITGYDRGKRRFIGHCLVDEPRRQYESWPPAVRMLVAVTGKPSPRGPEAVRDALQAGARRRADEGKGRYEAWTEEMRRLERPPGGEHELAVELLADARAAAAGFAERVSELEREIPAAWLGRAAERWREVVELLEARGVPWSPEALAALEEAGGREDWAELLEVAAKLEDEAAVAVRLSASADYLPDEASPW